MNRDTPDITDLSTFRERRLARKEDELDSLRNHYLEQLLDVLDEYLDEVQDLVKDDEKVVEELVAVSATLLALAAEENLEEEGREDFIDTVGEIAIDLLDEESGQGELFDDDEETDR